MAKRLTPKTVALPRPCSVPIWDPHQKNSDHQLGDPEKLATAVLALIESDDPPPQLLLGSDALKFVSARIDRLGNEIAAWRPVTLSTDG